MNGDRSGQGWGARNPLASGGDAFGRNQFGEPNRNQLNNFLGLPSDEGLQHMNAAHADNTFNFNRNNAVVASGNREGNVGEANFNRAPGLTNAGERWNQMTPSQKYASASAVRNRYNGWGAYGRGWYTDHPGAWYAAGWAAGSAWNTESWYGLGDWLGYYPPQAIPYDYGSSITYDGDNVLVNGQDQGTSAQYYQQAQQLAGSESGDVSTAGSDWLPLGVFALANLDGSKTNATVQLAISKQFEIRGNFTNTASGETEVIHGSADKKTQRVAFTVGDDHKTVYETGLYNLTKDEATALVHQGGDKTEQMLLVRLKKPSGSGSQ